MNIVDSLSSFSISTVRLLAATMSLYSGSASTGPETEEKGKRGESVKPQDGGSETIEVESVSIVFRVEHKPQNETSKQPIIEVLCLQ